VVEHQSGVTTPPPAAGEFVAFDVIASDRAGLTRVLVRLGAVEGAEMTVSVGVSLFDERFGLGDRRPRGLVEMSSFPNDVLDPAWCGGVLSVQVCAESPERAAAVVDEVAAVPGLALRWRMPGFRLDNHVGAGGKPVPPTCSGLRKARGTRTGRTFGSPPTSSPGPQEVVLAENVVRAGQVAWQCSLKMPRSR
jgi:deferrochelatase/peroxidase EfeB